MVANDARAMVDAVDQLLRTREMRVQIGHESRNLILKHYKWEDRIRSIESGLGGDM